jgi:hypothetical protein
MGLAIYFIFIILQVIWHYRIIEILKRVPNYTVHSIIRVVVAVVIMYFTNELNFINLITYGFVFWFVFDCLLNVSRKRSITYLGTNSVLDKIQKEYLGETLAYYAKFTIAFFLVCAYYFN